MGWLLRVKLKDLPPLLPFILKMKYFLSFEVFTFIVIVQTGSSKSMLFSAKREDVCIYYECASVSLDSLHHLFNSLIIPLFTYGISVLGVVGYDKSFLKLKTGESSSFWLSQGGHTRFKPCRCLR